jgi:hypothetical protein
LIHRSAVGGPWAFVAALIVFAPLAAPLDAPAAAVQEANDAERAREEAERLLEVARNGSPVVRPQAAARFARLGEPARVALEALSGDDLAGLAALGPELLGECGVLARGAFRARLHGALGDPDFPWRPAVLRGLAASAQPEDAASFLLALDDPLAAARRYAIDGLDALDQRDAIDAVRLRLLDEDGGVRAKAGLLLDRWGEPGALATTLEELSRADRFFDLENGARARRETAQLLAARIGDLHGYDPRELPDAGPNPRALEALRAQLRERAGDAWPTELPAFVRASATVAEGPLGLELRSCRAGELRLALTADDVLLVGEGNPARVELPEGTVAALVIEFSDMPERLGDDVFGRPGCDMERFRFTWPGATGPSDVHVLKDPEPAPDLRPEALNEFARALLELLPATGDDPRLVGLRGRARAILGAIGGPLEGASR